MSYDFDVAFSFLAEDESTSTNLAALIGGQARVFHYGEQQKELAGSDGMDAFSLVFGKRSHVVVMLYREGWGTTKWTRVEETAIKNRGLDDGWDFLLAISLDGTAPKWLPRTQLWLNWQRFGDSAAVAVILRKVTERGGALRDETAQQVAVRTQAEKLIGDEIAAILHSPKGVELARAALSDLNDYLESTVKSIRSGAPAIGLTFEKDHRGVVALSSPGYSITFAWSQQWANVLDQSSLVIRERAGPYGLGSFRDGDPELVKDTRASITLSSAKTVVWYDDEQPDQLLSTPQLAEKYLKRLLTHAGEAARYVTEDPDDEGGFYDLRPRY